MNDDYGDTVPSKPVIVTSEASSATAEKQVMPFSDGLEASKEGESTVHSSCIKHIRKSIYPNHLEAGYYGIS